MGKITFKNIKHTVECKCGYNSAEDYKCEISFKEMRERKFKKRVYKNTGETFFLWVEKFDVCSGCVYEPN